MSQRLHDTTKWVWCLLVVYSGAVWNPVRSVTVRSPPSIPSPIQAQAKFFQYRHFPSAEDYDQGHRLGSDRHFTERHERSRPSTGLFSAKVRWGDKKGGYGEHYWDLNHAGHAGDHGNDHANYDDGSYRERDSGDAYDEPSEQAPNYDTQNYDSDNTEQQEDSSREKRTPKRIRVERVQETEESNEENKPHVRRRPARKQKEQKEVVNEDSEEQADSNQEVYRKPAKTHQRRPQNQDNEEEEGDGNQEVYRKPVKPQQKRPQKQLQHDTEENKPTKEKHQVVLVVDEKEKEEQPAQYVQRPHEPQVFVPYEGGAGVRQHYAAEITPAASVPRLFLEPATGHVVDRATGQAYVLQPIIRNPTYS